MLDLDDIRAENGELIGREWPRQYVGGVNNPDTLERSHADVLLVQRPPV